MRNRAWWALVLAGLAAGIVSAQSEGALQDYFTGKKVIVKIDMPGTQEGIDVDVFSGGGRMDYSSYGRRLKQYGIAVMDGDTVTVTKVKVKGKNLEFQLDGGGFGTFGDDTNANVGWTACAKSNREKDLEKRLDEETNPWKRDQIKSELDDLRWRREREDNRRRDEAREASREKARDIMDNRARGGSRFNLHFGAKPGPDDLRPEVVLAALDEYLIFPWQRGGDPRERQNAGDERRGAVIRPSQSSGDLEKGMNREDVEVILGDPVSTKEITEGSLTVVQCVYETDRERITAQFIDGTLVKYSIGSK